MKNIRFTTSPGVPPVSMEEEFLSHKNCSEWWYATGYFNDESGRMFSFQFTLAKLRLYGIKFHVLLTSFTDFDNDMHYFEQGAAFFGRNIVTNGNRTSFGDRAEMTYERNEVDDRGLMRLHIRGKEYSLSLDMQAVKPPVWHCDNGVLQMGIPGDPKQTTFYYSYTNLVSAGKLVFENKEFNVTGKSWFDKQGGRYTITDRRCGWEWFSLRFFNNEEIMLFAFPQDDYYDGTFIEKTGAYRRLKDYSIEPLDFTEAGGYRFSNGWKLRIKGVKDEEYTIIPKIKGQFNLYFFESIAEIKDAHGKMAGYAVVELMPGVYNEKQYNLRVFKKV